MASLKPDQQPPIELLDLKGLSLKLDLDMRDPSSFIQLDNFDNYLSGSIRKCLPPSVFGVPTPAIILNFLDYRPSDTGARSIIGLGTDGKLYNLATGIQVGDCTPYLTTPISKVPYLGMMPGTFIPYNFRNWTKTTAYALNDALLKYSYQDGNLYVFVATVAGTSAATESAYPKTGTVVDGSVTWTNVGLQSNFLFELNYMVLVVPGTLPLKWDGTNVTQVGVSAPGTPVECNPKVLTPNNNGYNPLAGAYYAWTWFNPQTLHESSPSPLMGATSFFAVDQAKVVTVPGCFLNVLPQPVVPAAAANAPTIQQSSYQQIGICLRQSDLIAPAIGQGFTHVRMYRTKDGGGTLFLLTTLFDKNGNVITNSDGSVPIAALSQDTDDYVALPTPQSKQHMLCAYDGYGIPNQVPGAVFLDPNSWLDSSGGKIFVAPGGGQDGISNAFQYVGTGAASGILIKRSTNFNLNAGTYTLQGFIDAIACTAGLGVSWALISGSNVVVLNAAQTNGSAGTVHVTGAVPAGSYWIGFFVNGTVTLNGVVVGSNPVLQLGSAITTIGYPIPDSALITPSPDIDGNDPPFVSEWGAVYGSTLALLNEDDKVRLNYSDQLDFESFPVDNFVRFPTETDDSVTCLKGVFQSLIVGKESSIQRLDPPQGGGSGFVPTPVDPEHGLLGKRAITTLGSSLIGLIEAGISLIGLGLSVPSINQIQIGYRQEAFVGDDVKPITDRIVPSSKDNIIDFGYDPNQDMLLFAIQLNAASTYNDTMLLLSIGKGPKFSQYPAIVTGRSITSVRKVIMADGAKAVLATGSDKHTYKLFGGTQDGSITATAVTQKLPLPSQIEKKLWGQAKVFRQMWVSGVDLPNFMVSYSVDNGPYSVPVQLSTSNMVGLKGKVIQIKFTHSNPTNTIPILTYMNIDWEPIGYAR